MRPLENFEKCNKCAKSQNLKNTQQRARWKILKNVENAPDHKKLKNTQQYARPKSLKNVTNVPDQKKNQNIAAMRPPVQKI